MTAGAPGITGVPGAAGASGTAGPPTITPAAAARLAACVAGGGVVVFPTDTVYGIGCAPNDATAVERLYALKGRRPDKPAAVMFFSLSAALSALSELPAATRELLGRLLPGAVTALLPNPRARFGLACRPTPAVLGLRVPSLPPPLSALAALPTPLLQSSANLSGRPDACHLDDVPTELRKGADLALDGGALPGTPSTVLDLTSWARDGSWRIVRQGAVGADVVTRAVR